VTGVEDRRLKCHKSSPLANPEERASAPTSWSSGRLGGTFRRGLAGGFFHRSRTRRSDCLRCSASVSPERIAVEITNRRDPCPVGRARAPFGPMRSGGRHDCPRPLALQSECTRGCVFEPTHEITTTLAFEAFVVEQKGDQRPKRWRRITHGVDLATRRTAGSRGRAVVLVRRRDLAAGRQVSLLSVPLASLPPPPAQIPNKAEDAA
jgi:hypothetical protein